MAETFANKPAEKPVTAPRIRGSDFAVISNHATFLEALRTADKENRVILSGKEIVRYMDDGTFCMPELGSHSDHLGRHVKPLPSPFAKMLRELGRGALRAVTRTHDSFADQTISFWPGTMVGVEKPTFSFDKYTGSEKDPHAVRLIEHILNTHTVSPNRVPFEKIVVPGAPFGEFIRWADPVFPKDEWRMFVPKEYQGERDALIGAEHPAYTVRPRRSGIIEVHLEEPFIIRNFPKVNTVYSTDSDHGLPTTSERCHCGADVDFFRTQSEWIGIPQYSITAYGTRLFPLSFERWQLGTYSRPKVIFGDQFPANVAVENPQHPRFSPGNLFFPKRPARSAAPAEKSVLELEDVKGMEINLDYSPITSIYGYKMEAELAAHEAEEAADRRDATQARAKDAAAARLLEAKDPEKAASIYEKAGNSILRSRGDPDSQWDRDISYFSDGEEHREAEGYFLAAARLMNLFDPAKARTFLIGCSERFEHIASENERYYSFLSPVLSTTGSHLYAIASSLIKDVDPEKAESLVKKSKELEAAVQER